MLSGKAGIHYDTNMAQPDNYQTTIDSKTKIVVFHPLSNAFDFISGSKFREDYIKMFLK